MRAGNIAGNQKIEKSLSRNRTSWRQRAILVVAALVPIALLGGCIGNLNGTKATAQAAIQFTPANLNFGNVSVGKKATQTVAIKNSGTTTLNITNAELSSSQFTLSGITFPFSLVAGSTANLSVSFSGSSTGTTKGNLTLVTNSGTLSTPVALSANAVPAVAQLSVNPGSVGFGSVTTGSTDSSSVTLTNAGGSDLNISIITVNGTEFGVGGLTTPKTIPSGQSATISVSFSPANTGSASGSLAINSNDPQSPATIALTGTGTATAVGKLALNPGSLPFGNITVGNNNTLTSTVTNSGQATVHISQVSSAGTGITTSGLGAGSTIAAGQSAALQVRYAPTAAGSLTGSVTIVSDASVSPTTLNLTGAGVSNTPPVGSITAPVAGSTVSGSVNVTASASASAGVASVQFHLDGASVGAAETSGPYSYSWDTTKSSNGSHTLAVTVTDAANSKATSSNVTVSVNNAAADTTPPSVPGGLAATAASSSQINLSWNASTDNVGVTGYRIYRAGTQVGTASSTSYQDTGLNGGTAYSYTVAAYDAAGNVSGQSSAASATTQAATSNGGIPASLGWFQIPNSSMQPVCASASQYPDIQGSTGCASVMLAWGGAAADTKRNRMIVWGGGHTNYFGNEVYALDLNSLSMLRLNNPSPVSNVSTCPESYTDGTPSSRHTYDGLVYLPTQDKMFAYGGAKANCGYLSTGTWELDPSTTGWQSMDPHSGTTPGGWPGVMADYDPNTGLVFLFDTQNFFSYNPATNTYTKVGQQTGPGDNLTGVIDPGRKLFVMVGGGSFYAYTIGNGTYTLQNWTSQVSGCSALMSVGSPGLAYDPVQQLIVGWAGGNTVYQFNPDTKTCSAVTYPNGPGAQQQYGTYGRWRYFPSLGVFVIVNDWQQNAWTLRLTQGQGSSGTPAQGPAISGVTAQSITTTGATISWTTDAASTSQVEYGTSTAYGSLSAANSALVTSHSVGISGLTIGTTYHYRVHSKNSGGVDGVSGDAAFTTNSATDTTKPTVSMIAPVSGSAVSGIVTLSANASDNVGVSSVQFIVDGLAFGSPLSAAPYTISWDSSTVSAGTHTLTAQASDAAGNTATAVAVTVTTSASTAPSAAADFAARCQSPGVVKCVSFDSPSVIAGGYGNPSGVLPGDPTNLPTIDTSVTLSSSGSLRFGIPSNSGAGSAGSYFTNFSDDFSIQFGQGDEFYVQWRQRFSPEMLSTIYNGGEGWKQIIVGEGDRPNTTFVNSCTDMELVTVDSYLKNVPRMYHSCGAKDANYESLDYFDPTLGNIVVQNAVGCLYPTYVAPPCIKYQANQWMTFQMHVKIGTWYQDNKVYKHDSTVQLWVAQEGQPATLVIDFSPDPSDPSCQAQQVSIPNCKTGYDLVNTNPVAKYGKVWLLPYDTGKDATQVTAAAYTWYDELIISQQRIPDPK